MSPTRTSPQTTLTLAERIRFLSGRDAWSTESLPALGLPSVTLTDGPHGLRKQRSEGDTISLEDSVPATCFPTAAALACTWDVTLLERVGAALGAESRHEGVAVLLGPGLNIKRHPFGGRNFEYFSEDPHLAGRMAAALVRGIQSQEVAACLKHFAVNNQETRRLSVDAIVDERTMREIYLAAFETAVRESDPWSVMSAYNRVNGSHVGENPELMTRILRDEWGFTGFAMTDWIATYDRPAAIAAGLDLEMPGTTGSWDARVADAVAAGDVPVAAVDASVDRIASVLKRTAAGRGEDGPTPDFDAHHALAREAAAAAMVLLTNDGLLPLSPAQPLAVIGAFAERPRFQGAGSSLVNPTRVDGALDAFRAAASASVAYAPGYDPATGETTDALIAQAVAAAKAAPAVVLMVGLPAPFESEGWDRTNPRLPEGHERLIAAVCLANPRTVVVLANGGSVEMPWANQPAAILEAYLGGQAGGGAIADVVLGAAEPGGRLAESVAVSVAELPASANFPGVPTQVEYREGLYVGYRFHDTFDVAPQFSFGHGLSYTTFDYSDLAVRKVGEGFTVSVKVTNTGKRAGSDVVQVYVRDPERKVRRPEKELRAFAKVHLAPGKSQTVTLRLEPRAFAHWDVATHAWAVAGGDYEVLVGVSSEDIRARRAVPVASTDPYTAPPAVAGPVATDDEFTALLGRPVPTPAELLPFHYDSLVSDLKLTLAGRLLRRTVTREVRKYLGADGADASTEAFLDGAPLRGLAMMSGGKLSLDRLDGLIGWLNRLSPRVWAARSRQS